MNVSVLRHGGTVTVDVPYASDLRIKKKCDSTELLGSKVSKLYVGRNTHVEEN